MRVYLWLSPKRWGKSGYTWQAGKQASNEFLLIELTQRPTYLQSLLLVAMPWPIPTVVKPKSNCFQMYPKNVSGEGGWEPKNTEINRF